MKAIKLFAVSLVVAVLFTGAGHAQNRDQNWALCEGGDPNLSISACTALIESGKETRSNLAIAHNNRGITYSDKGDFDSAIADYERAMELSPNFSAAYNSLAWDLATMPDPRRRDGARAVELGEKAVALDAKQPGYLDTLAAAYAAAGRFDDAVAAQRRAIRLLGTSPAVRDIVADFESRQRLYEADKPFHR